MNHRRYEALRAYFVDELSDAEAGARFGYTRWAMVNLVRDYRTGKLNLFAPPRKRGCRDGAGQGARGRVIELRREGLSTYEISARLAAEHTPLNRTSVGEIAHRGRLRTAAAPPRPAGQHQPGHRWTRHPAPRTKRIDFGSWPATTETGKAGLLLLVPDLVSLGLPKLVRKAGYPGTRLVPAMSWLLSLLALKLTRTRRVSHVDDLLISDPAASLFAGLAVLPKKSRSPTTATAPATTISASSWPPSTPG